MFKDAMAEFSGNSLIHPITIFSNPCPIESQNNCVLISKLNHGEIQMCFQCILKRKVYFKLQSHDAKNDIGYICSENCLDNFKQEKPHFWEAGLPTLTVSKFSKNGDFLRHCVTCKNIQTTNYCLVWEGMDLCNELCLMQLQLKVCSVCVQCSKDTKPEVYGKFCNSFGADIRQFCTVFCLNNQQSVFRACSYCLQDLIRTFYIILEENEQFCSDKCQENFQALKKPATPQICKYCRNEVQPLIIYKSPYFDPCSYFCSVSCFEVFCTTYSIHAKICSYCMTYNNINYMKKYILEESQILHFCSNVCKKLYMNSTKKLTKCEFCKMIKYNIDMIQKYFQNKILWFCSINCLGLYKSKWEPANELCNFCLRTTEVMFGFSACDQILHFCSFTCLIHFAEELSNIKVVAPKENNVVTEESATNSGNNNQKQLTPKETENSSISSTSNQENSAPNNAILDNNLTEELTESYINLDHNSSIKNFLSWIFSQNLTQNDTFIISSPEMNTFLTLFIRSCAVNNSPDNIFYTCLGIQKFLLQFGSSDAIFYDKIYDEFQNTLSYISMSSQLSTSLVPVVEEEYLWETKFLGSHSPDVLINTLIFLLTKNCQLTSVKKHLGLSLKQLNRELIKKEKLNNKSVTVSCLYKSSSNSERREFHILYSDGNNEPRCPISLCQLYLNKCSDIKNHDKYFYFQPNDQHESPKDAWFKTSPLLAEDIYKVLGLIRLVKQINNISSMNDMFN